MTDTKILTLDCEVCENTGRVEATDPLRLKHGEPMAYTPCTDCHRGMTDPKTEIHVGLGGTSVEVDADEDLSVRLKAAGMFTIEQMMDDNVSGLGPFDTHAGVHTFEDVCEWVDRKRLEYTRMRARHELDKTEGVNELYEWTLAHSAAFTSISKHLRKVKSSQVARIAELNEALHLAERFLSTGGYDQDEEYSILLSIRQALNKKDQPNDG